MRGAPVEGDPIGLAVAVRVVEQIKPRRASAAVAVYREADVAKIGDRYPFDPGHDRRRKRRAPVLRRGRVTGRKVDRLRQQDRELAIQRQLVRPLGLRVRPVAGLPEEVGRWKVPGGRVQLQRHGIHCDDPRRGKARSRPGGGRFIDAGIDQERQCDHCGRE